jgi:hypothetical protein
MRWYMLIPKFILEPFGVLGFPKPMPNTITNVADPMAMVQALSIEKQRIINEVLDKINVIWNADIAEETNGVYEITEETWKSQK